MHDLEPKVGKNKSKFDYYVPWMATEYYVKCQGKVAKVGRFGLMNFPLFSS